MLRAELRTLADQLKDAENQAITQVGLQRACSTPCTML